MLKPFLKQNEAAPPSPGRSDVIVPTILIGAAVLWAWFPIILNMVQRWNSDPQYSHGFLVPVIAAMIVWYRREDVTVGDHRASAWGLVLIVAGIIGYLIGTRIYFDWLQLVSILPVLYGATLLIGGTWLSRVAWPGVLFLLFMIPLPYMAEVAMARPLQTFAGTVSTYLLQTLGFTAIQRGNLIDMEGHVLGVAEACSGLRMLVVFFALATAVAILSDRSWLHRFIVVLSAIPIALICNIGRIAITGALYVYAGPELAERVFHDFAGWLMMPAALLLMWLEIKYLNLVIVESGTRPAAGGGKAAGVLGLSV